MSNLNPGPFDGTKVCRRCRGCKPATDFSPNPNGRYGLNTNCRPCACEVAAEWHRRNPGARHRQKLTAYDLTPEQYDEMLTAQDGRCAICRRPPKARRLAVDHDHTSGRVRGLLCSNCNTALGLLGDNAEALLTAMVGYLSVRSDG